MFVDGNIKRGNVADVGGFFGNNRNFFDEVQNLRVVKLVKAADAVGRGNALGNGGVRLPVGFGHGFFSGDGSVFGGNINGNFGIVGHVAGTGGRGRKQAKKSDKGSSDAEHGGTP